MELSCSGGFPGDRTFHDVRDRFGGSFFGAEIHALDLTV
jgi:hypothetical protein